MLILKKEKRINNCLIANFKTENQKKFFHSYLVVFFPKKKNRWIRKKLSTMKWKFVFPFENLNHANIT